MYILCVSTCVCTCINQKGITGMWCMTSCVHVALLSISVYILCTTSLLHVNNYHSETLKKGNW